MNAMPQRDAPAQVKDAPRLFYAALVIGVLMKDALSGEVLDVFVPYTRSEGSALTKIHPGSYILITLGMLVFPRLLKSARLRGNHVMIASLLLLASVVVVTLNMVLRHETGGASYLIDSVVVAPMCLFALTALSPAQRLSLAMWVLKLILLNDLVVFAELATHSYFLPHPETELVFRPPGLFNHPLRTGLNSVAALPSLFLLPLTDTVRWMVTVTFWLAIAASQARMATLFSSAFLLIAVPLSAVSALRRKTLSPVTAFVFGAVILVTIPGLIGVLYELGLFERLSGGFTDSSTLARVDIYKLFDFFTMDEFLWGSSAARATYIATYALHIPIIESPIIIFIAMFGVFGAILLAFTLSYFFLALVINGPFLSKLALVAFLALAFANNSIAQKGETTVSATVLLYIAANYGRRSQNRRPSLDPFAVGSHDPALLNSRV